MNMVQQYHSSFRYKTERHGNKKVRDWRSSQPELHNAKNIRFCIHTSAKVLIVCFRFSQRTDWKVDTSISEKYTTIIVSASQSRILQYESSWTWSSRILHSINFSEQASLSEKPLVNVTSKIAVILVDKTDSWYIWHTGKQDQSPSYGFIKFEPRS
jgi:hypothetical protein